MAVEIPLKQFANNSFPVTLDGENFIFTTIWNSRGETWRLSVKDSTGNPIVLGLTMFPNQILNAPYFYNKTPKGLLIVESKTASTIRPTFESLGTSVKLLYVSEEELSEFI